MKESISFREFVERKILLSDKGQALQPSPLLAGLVGAIESGAREILIACPRRSGKSSAVAQVLAWQLLTRPLSFCIAIAGAEHQAEDVQIQKLHGPLKMRSELRGSLTFARDRLTSSLGATVQVIPAKDATAPGRTLDVLVIDEARSVDEQAVEVLRPSAAGGLIIILGSPGPRSHWWHRAIHEPTPRATVLSFTDPVALNPTLDAGFVESERQRLERRGGWGAAMYAREWQGAWVELSEHPLLNPADVAACSRPAEEIERHDASLDTVYVGVDLSLVRDLTSVIVLARRQHRYRILDATIYDPRAFGANGIPLEVVERRLEFIWRKFRPRKILIDRWQAVSIVERLKKRGAPIEAIPVTTGSNAEAFEALTELVTSHAICWARNQRLETELCNLSLDELPSGNWRVVDSDRRLHRDVSWSLAAACLAAVRGGKFNREPGYNPAQVRGEAIRGWPAAYVRPSEDEEQRAKVLREIEELQR